VVSDYLQVQFPTEMNIITSYMYSMFVLLLVFTTLIIPTGKYFIALGSSEVLVFTLWFIITYLLLFIRVGSYMSQIFLASTHW